MKFLIDLISLPTINSKKISTLPRAGIESISVPIIIFIPLTELTDLKGLKILRVLRVEIFAEDPPNRETTLDTTTAKSRT